MGFFNDIEDHYAAELKAAIDTWGLDAANRIWTNVPDKPLVKLPFVSVETIGLMPGGLQNTDRMELTHEFCIAFPVNQYGRYRYHRDPTNDQSLLREILGLEYNGRKMTFGELDMIGVEDMILGGKGAPIKAWTSRIEGVRVYSIPRI